jgi:putative SOS response-associated peptidase YedK
LIGGSSVCEIDENITMCGRFALSAITKDIEKLQQGILSKVEIKPRFNIAPSQDIAALLNDSPEKIITVRWGLIPYWAKDLSIGYKMINARSETIDSKPSYKIPFRQKRCLIFASGFYEWKKNEDKKVKTPYYFHLLNDEIFTFAGLWSFWEKGEEPITSATIITTAANDTVKPIHDRMPAIIRIEDWEKWLSLDTDLCDLKDLLKPFPANEMDTYEVSQAVNNPSHDSPELIEKAG